MTWPIRERSIFPRFRTDGRRFRHGPLWVSWIADPAAVPPRVAYALGRTVGRAVTRNRLRRRLRALVAHEASAGLPAGWYLIGADAVAVDLDAPTLSSTVHHLAERCRAAAA